jgi:hypothetical protein
MEDYKRLSGPMSLMTCSLVALVASPVIFVATVLVSNRSGEGAVSAIAGYASVILIAVCFIAICAFYLALARLSSRLNLNALQWVGLTVVTSPFGIPIAYSMIRTRVMRVTPAKGRIRSVQKIEAMRRALGYDE